MHQISNIYFVIKLYKFRASSVPIIRSYLLYTRQLVRFTQIVWPLPSRVRLELRVLQGTNRPHYSHDLSKEVKVHPITCHEDSEGS